MLDILKLGDDVSIEVEKDVIYTGGAWETDVYPLVLKCVYIDQTKSGAVMANMIFVDENGREHTESDCIMSKKSGSLKATYMDKKTNKPMALPGYSRLVNLFRTINGNAKLKDLSTLDAGEAVLELWDYEAGKKTKQKKTVFADYLNVPVQVALQKIIKDKTKNVAAEGEKADYQPTGETYETNEAKKWFNEDGKTLQEVMDDTESKFKDEWLETYQGQTRDMSKAKKDGSAKAGAPASAATPSVDLDLS